MTADDRFPKVKYSRSAKVITHLFLTITTSDWLTIRQNNYVTN
jgi:hypothetical protein